MGIGGRCLQEFFDPRHGADSNTPPHATRTVPGLLAARLARSSLGGPPMLHDLARASPSLVSLLQSDYWLHQQYPSPRFGCEPT